MFFRRFLSFRYADALILAVLCGVIFLLNLGGYPLLDVDEPRYAETAREMLTTPGDWITPHFNWHVRFDKPVLFYWLIALSYKVFGVSEFAARLISALAASGIAVMLYAVLKHLESRSLALMGATVFATMIMAALLGRWAITDMTLSCFMVGTWLALLLVILKSPRWFVVAGLFSGLGMLTKGPVALVLPGLTFLLAMAFRFRRQWRLLLSPWLYAGLAVFALVSFPWYWMVAQANPEAFMGTFFLLHNVTRFASTVSGHQGPWYYYFPIILIGTFPWSFFIPGLIGLLYTQRKRLPDTVLYAFLWFLVVFVFFSLANTKLLTYILPGVPALAILIAWYWHQQGSELQRLSAPQKGLKRALWFGTGIVAAALGASFYYGPKLLPSSLSGLLSISLAQALLFILLLAFIGALIWLGKAAKGTCQAFWALAAGMALLLGGFNLLLMPQVANLLQEDVMAFSRRAVADNAFIATYHMKKTSPVFYTQRKVYYLPRPEHMAAHAEQVQAIQSLHDRGQSVYLIVKNREWPELEKTHEVALLQRGRVYSLARLDRIRSNNEDFIR